jgi:hypothetical protein
MRDCRKEAVEPYFLTGHQTIHRRLFSRDPQSLLSSFVCVWFERLFLTLTRDCGIEGNRSADLSGIFLIRRDVIVELSRFCCEVCRDIRTLSLLSLEFDDSRHQLQDLVLYFTVLSKLLACPDIGAPSQLAHSLEAV